MKSFIKLTFVHFFLFPPLLFGGEKVELKKSRMDRVTPSYESFVRIQTVLQVLAGKAIYKHQAGKEYLFNPVVCSMVCQTQQGIRVLIERNRSLLLQTEFGAVNITTNSHIRHEDIVGKLWSADTPIAFDEFAIGTMDCGFYNIKAIGAESLPQARVAVKYLPVQQLNNLWNTYSQTYETAKTQNSAKQSNVVSARVRKNSVDTSYVQKHDINEQKQAEKNTDDDEKEDDWVLIEN